MTFDASAIQGYAVKAVTEFVAEGIPLSQGIAKIASANELNPEQIKRVVETSNTLAHLKLLEGSKDRTFEFPVAKYESVLGHMVNPSAGGDVQLKEQESEAMSSEMGHGEATKYASADLENTLFRGAISAKAQIEKLAYEKQIIRNKMETSIKKIASAEFPLEKLAEVATEEEYCLVSSLFNIGQVKSAKLVFKDQDLEDVRDLLGLVKQAKEIAREKHEKTAFLAAAGKVIGSVIGKPVNFAAGKAVDAIKGIGGEAKSLRTSGHLSSTTQQKLKRLGAASNATLNIGVAGMAIPSEHNPLNI